jgi:hypothetical protein
MSFVIRLIQSLNEEKLLHMMEYCRNHSHPINDRTIIIVSFYVELHVKLFAALTVDNVFDETNVAQV